MSTPIILIVVAVLLVIFLVSTYNGLIVLKTRIQEALSGIDVQLKEGLISFLTLLKRLKDMPNMRKVFLRMLLKREAHSCLPVHCKRKQMQTINYQQH